MSLSLLPSLFQPFLFRKPLGVEHAGVELQVKQPRHSRPVLALSSGRSSDFFGASSGVNTDALVTLAGEMAVGLEAAAVVTVLLVL